MFSGRMQHVSCHVAHAYGTCFNELTFAKEFARAKEFSEIASRAQTGCPIGTEKATFDSSVREEDGKIVALRFL